MTAGILLDRGHRMGNFDIYYKVVKALKNQGLTGKLIGELTTIPPDSEWLLSYESSFLEPIGTAKSYSESWQGGAFEFRQMDKDLIQVDNNEVAKLFGWIYLVGGRWLPK